MATSIIKSPNSVTIGNATKVSSAISEFEFAQWYKVGNLCIMKFKFTTNAEITNMTEVLFSGFPNALAWQIAFCHSVSSENVQKIIRLRITTEGTLTNGYTPGGIPAEQWEGTAVYFTA